VQNMSSNNVTGKAMYSVLFTKAHIQVYADFPWRLVSHNHRHGGVFIMMVFTSSTSKECNNFCQAIMPTVYNFVDGWKENIL